MAEPYSDEEWRLIAERLLDRWESDRAAARDYTSAQSRWMVAQLFVANGGALTALAASQPLKASLASAAPWFVGGVALAILCGLATWIRAQHVAATLAGWADPALPFDRQRWPKDDPARARRSKFVHGLAVAAGLLSLICFVLGAWSIRP